MRRFGKWLSLLAIVSLFFVLAPITSYATTTAHAVASVATAPPSILGIPLSTATVLAFTTAYFMPLVSALLSHPRWSQNVEGYITIVLASVSGFLTEWANSTDASHYDWKKALVISGLALATAIAGRVGLWRKTALAAALSAFPAVSPAAPPNG